MRGVFVSSAVPVLSVFMASFMAYVVDDDGYDDDDNDDDDNRRCKTIKYQRRYGTNKRNE